MAKIQSIEPNIADLGNGWLKSYGLDYKLEQASLNSEIDKALKLYPSKTGGTGINRPDASILITHKKTGKHYPILIEYKGYKDKLIKLNKNGRVDNKKSDNTLNFKNISTYAVNGAIHYANAVLLNTSYEDIIAIGMTGYKDGDEIKTQIGVYLVSKTNFGDGQKIDEYSDFSFLSDDNFDEFIEKIEEIKKSEEEIEKIKEQKEREIELSIKKLNNDIYKEKHSLSETDRVYLVAASIMATIGIPNKVAPLEKDELKSSNEDGYRDGEIILRKIKNFLKEKSIPEKKRDLIIRTLANTLTAEHLNKVENGETQIKKVFNKIIDDIGIYYKIGLTTDFTGKLFNEMYSWLGFSQDKLNDVVLTPSYVANLLVKLAKVNKDSYLWDFATGSAGLLVAAMNEMLKDAKRNIHSPNELRKKELEIKAKQILGIEILQNIYMLAILNMILMGDGSSNILNEDSLNDYDGKYGYEDKKFPATAFVLNPPYSAQGNGMIFVKKALNMMKSGYAAIIIQSSTGSGKAIEYNKEILQNNTLIASIKMPVDIFIGKSSVQTHIYVFKVGEKHDPKHIVKFIDFSDDGYQRSNRKKASNNLKDVNNAKKSYEELVNVVHYGKAYLDLIGKENYYEGTIDPKNGADWNQSAPIDTTPTLKDFQKTISDYLSWEISTILKEDLGKI